MSNSRQYLNYCFRGQQLVVKWLPCLQVSEPRELWTGAHGLGKLEHPLHSWNPRTGRGEDSEIRHSNLPMGGVRRRLPYMIPEPGKNPVPVVFKSFKKCHNSSMNEAQRMMVSKKHKSVWVHGKVTRRVRSEMWRHCREYLNQLMSVTFPF